MTEKIPGMRVGVFPVELADDAHTYHYGKGTYEEAFVPPLDFDLGELPQGDLGEATVPVPRIQLDSGGRIWGYECWWMPEEEFDAALKDAAALGKEVTLVRFIRGVETSLN